MNERMRESGDLAPRFQTAPWHASRPATQVVGEVHGASAELREATARVYEVGRDVASLQDISAPEAPRTAGEL